MQASASTVGRQGISSRGCRATGSVGLGHGCLLGRGSIRRGVGAAEAFPVDGFGDVIERCDPAGGIRCGVVAMVEPNIETATDQRNRSWGPGEQCGHDLHDVGAAGDGFGGVGAGMDTSARGVVDTGAALDQGERELSVCGHIRFVSRFDVAVTLIVR